MDDANWFEGMEDYRKEEDEDEEYFPKGTVHQDEYFDLGDMHFVWDKAKSDKNLRKRGFSFVTAAMIFNDEAGFFEQDPDHSIEEERMIGLGKPTDKNENGTAYIGEVNNVLYVTYTDRAVVYEGNDEDDLDLDLVYHRIISARKASNKERKFYEDRKAILFGSY